MTMFCDQAALAKGCALRRVQARIDMVFDDGDLIARGNFQYFPARSQGNGSARRILKIGRKDHQLHAISRQVWLRGLRVYPERAAGFRVRLHRHAQATRTRAIENRQRRPDTAGFSKMTEKSPGRTNALLIKSSDCGNHP